MKGQHGTVYGYVDGKCRCNDCRQAHAEYRQRQVATRSVDRYALSLPTMRPIPYQDWTDDAACLQHDPDTMYPNYNEPTQVEHALRVCDGCTVRVPCIALAYATNDRWAVMGGTTPNERSGRSGPRRRRAA